MNKKIIKRVLDESNYILDTGKTVREIAKVFKVSKSTVHQDLSERLKELDSNKYIEVLEILKYHYNMLDALNIKNKVINRLFWVKRLINYSFTCNIKHTMISLGSAITM